MNIYSIKDGLNETNEKSEMLPMLQATVNYQHYMLLLI